MKRWTSEPKTLRELFERTKVLLSREDNWTKGQDAQTRNENETCSPFDKEAFCFCLSGAIQRAACHRSSTLVDDALFLVFKLLDRQSGKRKRKYKVGTAHVLNVVQMFNDAEGRKHKDIIEIVEMALIETA